MGIGLLSLARFFRTAFASHSQVIMVQYRSDLFVHLPDVETQFAAGFPLVVNTIVASVRQAPGDVEILRTAAVRLRDAAVDLQGAVAATVRAYVVDCYLRLAALGALTAEDRLELGRAFLAAGSQVEACETLLDGAAERPSTEILSIAGSLADAGRHRAALILMLSRRARRREDIHYLRLLAFLLGQCGRHTAALRVARGVSAQDASDRTIQVFMASQMVACGFHDEAGRLILALGERTPGENELAASILLHLGRHAEALMAANEALIASPGNPAYLGLRATILAAMHRMEEAADDVLAAWRLRAEDEALNRSAFIIATEAGRYDAALMIGAWLVARFPDEEGLSHTLKIVMERRDRQRLLERIDSSRPEPVLAAPNRAHERWSSDHEHPLAQQMRIILALILRETKTRFGRARFGYFWVIFEPLAHIGIMITLISLFSHSNLPPIGPNFALFYFTGIIPYHLFTHTVSHMINSVPENRPLLHLPLVKPFDVFVARGVLELITELSVAAILMLGFVVFGLFTRPDNISGIALAIALIWVTGFGLGLLSAVISSFFSGWERIWGALSSLLYFSSGTFYIPRMMPEYLRSILAWNPILQAIELIRSSYFYTPSPFWLDVRYMLACALGMLALGLVAQRVFRAKLLGTE